MKNLIKSFTSIVYIAVMAALISLMFDANPTLVFGALLIGSFMLPRDVAFDGITVEIWAQDIIDNYFKDAQFIKRAFPEDKYVLNGKVVHIPVAGKPRKGKKNIDTFPVAAKKRGDDDLIYVLDTFYREPSHIEKLEEYEISYDKRQSVLGEEQAQLIQDAHDGLLFNWALTGKNMDAAGNYILTKGKETELDILTGATGARRTFDKQSFFAVKKKMDNDNIPSTGRLCVLTANHYNQLLESLTDKETTEMYRFANMETGIIGRWLGFDIYMRSTVQRWRKVAGLWTPVDEQEEDFAAGAGDSAASIFYHDKAVSRALGEVNMYDERNKAEYYGDIFSMNLRSGGRQRRKEGFYAVIEDIVVA